MVEFIKFNNHIVNLREIVHITVKFSNQNQIKTGVVLTTRHNGTLCEWYSDEEEACMRYHEFLGLLVKEF